MLLVLALAAAATGCSSTEAGAPSDEPAFDEPLPPPPSQCGNGILDSDEVCDDGNTTSGDGCREDCRGYEACGDGLLDQAEACDDGNVADEDGCSRACEQEDGYVCLGEPSACAAMCGNGFIDDGETCDDANQLDGDGCSSACHIEEAEPNNTVGAANAIVSLPSVRAGSIGASGDVDYYMLSLSAGQTLRFETSAADDCDDADAADTVISLFAPDGVTQVADDDDSGVGYCSTLQYVVPVSGFYYASVKAWGVSQIIPAYQAWFVIL